MLAPPPSLPWKIRANVSLHRSTLILSVTQTFHFKTFVLVFFRKHVFTSSCVWILYLLENLIVFSFFCSKRYFNRPVPSSVQFVFSSCLAFRFQHVRALSQAVSCPLAAESRRLCGICVGYMVILRTISPSISDFLSVSYPQSSVIIFHLFIADTNWRH